MLVIGFACTALTIDLTINQLEVLQLDGQKIERRLHRKEQFVKNFINDIKTRDSLRNITKNEAEKRHRPRCPERPKADA